MTQISAKDATYQSSKTSKAAAATPLTVANANAK